MAQSETTKDASWMLGYQHGKAGLFSSMIARFPDDIKWAEYHVGYAVGARDRRSAEIMDEWEAATND